MNKPARKKRATEQRGTKKIVFIVLGCIGGFVVLMAVLLLLILSVGSKEPSAFVDAIASGSYRTAYDFFSADLKNAQSFEEFKEQMQTLGLDETCQFKVNSTSMSGGVKDTSGVIRCNERALRAKFLLLNTHDGYRFVEYSINP